MSDASGSNAALDALSAFHVGVGSVSPASFDVTLLPALLIVVPILAAAVPIALDLRYDRTGWTVALVTTAGLFAGAIAIARDVYTDAAYSRVIHEVGGFPAPYGIELVADEFSTLIALLVTGTAVAVLAYTRIGGPRGSTFYAAYLLLTGGLLGLSFTGDAFNMFVFLEIVGLATYGLIARGDSAESAVAALKYLILGTLGASLYLLGVGLLFMATGHLNMISLGQALNGGEPVPNETLVNASFAFVFVGFAIKVAQWPLHTWQPDAYQRAPDGITPLIAALVSTVSAYALGRILFTVYGVDFVTTTPYVQEVILTVGIISVMAGSILAVMQTDVKRMLAYSSVSQFGLIVAAYGLATPVALIGAMVHLVGHGLMKAGLFLGAGVVAVGYGARRVRAYAGLAEHRPVAAASIAVLAISLVGIPPSIGFIGKWYIAIGAVQAEVWTVAAVIFLSTMLTLLYVARLLETMYFTPASARPSGYTDSAYGSSNHAGSVATDGGAPDDSDGHDGWRSPDATANTTDIGVDSRTTHSPRVSVGMLAIVVVFAVLAVVLGFAGDVLYEAVEPFAEEVFEDG